MIRSQNLLQQLGIVQQEVLNLNPMQPAQAVLDQAAQDCIAIYQALTVGTYKSPAYPVGSDPMAQFDPVLTAKQNALSLAMQAAELAGNIALYHADLDQLNQVKAQMGLAEITGQPDISVLCNAPGQTGFFAQYIVNQVAEGKTLFTDLTACGKVIAAAQAGSVPPAPAPVAIADNSTTTPAGTRIKDAAGSVWQYLVTPFGNEWIRIFTIVAAFVLLAAPFCRAQVTVGCAPQPMAATRGINEKVMGPWLCWLKNAGAAPVTVNPSDFYTALLQKISPVGPATANQIIADSINRLPQSKFVTVGKIAVTLGAAAYGIYSGNATVPLAVGLGVQNAPQVISLIQGTIPSAAPYTGGQMTGPITIPPGGDVPAISVYALKVQHPGPFAGVFVK